MKMKDQVSFELAKQLKELGMKQDSLWYWCEYNEENAVPCLKLDRLAYKFIRQNRKREIYSAFTIAELCEGLPARIKTDYYRSFSSARGSWSYLHIGKVENTKEWFVGYYHDIEIKGSTLANACAKMRIHLLKTTECEVDEINGDSEHVWVKIPKEEQRKITND